MAKCLSVEWVDFCRVNCISPDFIATEILDIHPEEWRNKWYDMIPAKRMAQTYELKGVSYHYVLTTRECELTESPRRTFSVLRTHLAT